MKYRRESIATFLQFLLHAALASFAVGTSLEFVFAKFWPNWGAINVLSVEQLNGTASHLEAGFALALATTIYISPVIWFTKLWKPISFFLSCLPGFIPILILTFSKPFSSVLVLVLLVINWLIISSLRSLFRHPNEEHLTGS